MACSPDEDQQSPSAALVSMFRACHIDPTEKVQSHLDQTLRRFEESLRSTTTDHRKLVRLQKCCSESKMWFYTILKSLLQEKKPGFETASSFLEDRKQCSLVLCCLEISSFVNKLSLDLDLQLQVFSLAPFHFWKVLILVLQTKDLTLCVTQHLVKVEERILVTLGWRRGSPLWDQIRANEGQMPHCHQVMLTKDLEEMRREQSDHDTIQVDTTSDHPHSTLSRPQRRTHLCIFAHKVYRLMDRRLSALCSALNLEEELRQKIWTCLEQSLVHHFDLLQDRELDWLLLSATYGLTKDIRELPFKHIIDCYRRINMNKYLPTVRESPEIPQSDLNPGGRLLTPNTPSTPNTPNTPSVCQEEQALASFFWQVYTPVMGRFIQMFSPAAGTGTPRLSPFPTPPAASSHKVRLMPGSNIYISPLNKETRTQRCSSGMDYVFQSSPSQRLDQINFMVSSRRPRFKRGLTFSGREEDKDEESGPPAKIMSSLERRLQDVEQDRKQSQKHFYI